MNEILRKLRVRIENLITRAVMDRPDSNGRYLQVLWGGDRVSADVEHLEPQGLHFCPPADASLVVLAPGGSRAGVVALGAGGEVPADAVAAGEGGLHYLGTYKVFLAADGSTCLGAKEPDDFVALASKVDAFHAAIHKLFSASWTPTPNDGGAALKLAYGIAFPKAPASVASSTVKVQS